MAIAASAWFDSGTEGVIRSLWEQLHDCNISSVFHGGPYRPHITLGVFDELKLPDFSKALRTELTSVRPFDCEFSFVGVFPNSPVVGFLGVTQTTALKNLHGLTQKLMAEYGANPREYYLPERWNPHCSLAPNLESSVMADFSQFLSKLRLPIRGIIQSVGIIDTPAEIELDQVDLASLKGV